MPTLKIACQGADTLPYTALTEFQGNLKNLSKDDFKAMRRQLIENGFSFPMAVWVSPEGKNCILDGHQRLRVIRELAKEGWTIPELPVDWIEADSEQQAKEKLLAAAGAFGTVSDQGLYELITSADLDIDRIAEMTRFREIDFDVFKEEYFLETPQPTEGLTDPDDVPENVETRVKPGDLWILGNHRLLCGDSTKKEDVDRLMDGEKADMVYTDPPYGMALDTDYRKNNGPDGYRGKDMGRAQGLKHNRVIGDHQDFDPKLINMVLTFFSDCQELFLWGADYYAEHISKRNAGSWIVWDKVTKADGEQSGVERFHGSNFELCWSKAKHKRDIARIMHKGFTSIENEKRIHPTQKPVALAMWFFKRWGNSADLIADLFLGSGSTLIACEKTGRRCFGIEIDPHYCSVIIERWEKFTGKKAVKT